MSVKGFYLLPYSTALRTLLFASLQQLHQ